MVAAISSNGKAKTAKPRLMGLTALLSHIADGGEVRRGTILKRAFPVWEWQAFDGAGRFVAPVDWRAVHLAVDAGSLTVSDAKGLNR